MFEAHAGGGGAERPMNALLGRVAGLRPGGALRVDRGLRRHVRGQGLPRQDAQLRFSHVEPTAVPGRKRQLYAPGQKSADSLSGSPVGLGLPAWERRRDNGMGADRLCYTSAQTGHPDRWQL